MGARVGDGYPENPAHESTFTFSWNGQEIRAHRGATILGALLASGHRVLRTTRIAGEPRGPLCGIGVCYECLVTVDGKPNRRACVTAAKPGMVVTSGAVARADRTES